MIMPDMPWEGIRRLDCRVYPWEIINLLWIYLTSCTAVKLSGIRYLRLFASPHVGAPSLPSCPPTHEIPVRPRHPARGGRGRLPRHSARREQGRGAGRARGLPRQVEAALPGGGGELGRGRGAPVHLPALPARAVAFVADDERHRAPARGVRATDRDAVRPALRRDRRDTVLGPSGLGPDHPAQGARLAETRPDPGRS